MTGDVQHALIRRFRVKVIEWDRAEHDGEAEPWESMRERLLAELPRLLEQDGQQRVADVIAWESYTDPQYDRRAVLAALWTVPVDVPADVAARIDGAAVDRLAGVVTYEPVPLE